VKKEMRPEDGGVGSKNGGKFLGQGPYAPPPPQFSLAVGSVSS